jgi:hypothetical protein
VPIGDAEAAHNPKQVQVLASAPQFLQPDGIVGESQAAGNGERNTPKSGSTCGAARPVRPTAGWRYNTPAGNAGVHFLRIVLPERRFSDQPPALGPHPFSSSSRCCPRLKCLNALPAVPLIDAGLHCWLVLYNTDDSNRPGAGCGPGCGWLARAY